MPFPAVLPSATSELLHLSHQRDKQVQELKVGVGTAGSPAHSCIGQGQLPVAGTAQGWAALGKAGTALFMLSHQETQNSMGVKNKTTTAFPNHLIQSVGSTTPTPG